MLLRSAASLLLATALWLWTASCAYPPSSTSPVLPTEVAQVAVLAASQDRAEYSVETGTVAIRFAYDRFLEMFFRPLRPSELLVPAWDALAKELDRAGVAAASSLEPPKISDDVESAWEAFRSGYVEIATRYGSLLDQRRLAHAVIAGMAAGLRDCHTVFVTPEQFRAQRQGSRYVGIGVSIRASGQDYPLLLEVFPGGPAAQAGLRRGDRLVSIDGQDLAGLSSTQVSEMLRGPNGSSVRLSVRRASNGGLIETELSRQELQPPVFAMQALEDSIGYMRFYSFGPGLSSQFEAGLEDLLKAGIKGLIIDVRSNPGGSGVDRIVSKFVPAGDLYYLQDRKGNRHIGKADGSYRPGMPPLVVIVDQGSASAAELFAATLQDLGAAAVVGSPTRGCLATVEQVALPDQSAIRITTQTIVLARSGRNITNVGVVPDHPVELRPDDLAARRDPQLERALAVLRAEAPRAAPQN